MFEQIECLPPDPILGLSAACKADPNPDKVDLTIGVYMTDEGVTPVFEAVKQAQQALTAEEISKVYLPPAGPEDFNRGMQALLFGQESSLLRDQRLASAQTPGGCGALRLGAELVAAANPSARVWTTTPTWANHIPLLGSAGLEVKGHRYYDKNSHGVDFAGMLEDLEQVRAGDVLLLHGCCHNPCGADLSREQWRAVADLVEQKGLLPFVDIAYQGLGDGLEEDAWGLRHLVESVPEALVAASCSKNLGLYRERTGIAVFIGSSGERSTAMLSQALVAARRNYSMPPAHGALLAGRILNDEALGQLWREELVQMCGRINGLRSLLAERLTRETGRDFSFIEQEKGMFSFLGVSEAEVTRLREKNSVYMLGSSRVNVAGVNEGNVDYLAAAVAGVLA